MPLITFGLLGSGYADHAKLIWIMVELILAPLVISRVLRWIALSEKLEPIKGRSPTGGSFWSPTRSSALNRAVSLKPPVEYPARLSSGPGRHLPAGLRHRENRAPSRGRSPKTVEPGPAGHP